MLHRHPHRGDANSNWIRQVHGSSRWATLSTLSTRLLLAYRVCARRSRVDARQDAQRIGGQAHGHAVGIRRVNGARCGRRNHPEYSSTLEGRADLVALFFLLDQKMVELGLMKTLDVRRAEYGLRNSMMTQLQGSGGGRH